MSSRPRRIPENRAITPREEDVLNLLAEGAPNKEIADSLGLSVQTVKVHTWYLFRRTGTKNRLELAIYWLKVRHRIELEEVRAGRRA